MPDLRKTVERAKTVLTEGAVIERLRRDPAVKLDPHVLNAGLVYDDAGREAMAAIYRQYLEIGHSSGLPMLIAAPTWRTGGVRVMASVYRGRNVAGDAAAFILAVREEFGSYADLVPAGGLMSCRGDAYKPAEALGRVEARLYHRSHAKRLASSGLDYLMGATLPALSEAWGMAAAMAETGLPYIISFIIRSDGRLLDGTRLSEAVRVIDSETDPAPFCYMVNCVHPDVLEAALSVLPAETTIRLRGIQANTSALNPEDLDGSQETDSGDPERFARSLARLNQTRGITILGGCCGTDHRHIRALARLAAERPQVL